MYYHLITGATGLLGGYLLRDLIDADVSLAVLARGTDENSGYRRIDDILSHWERLAGFSLPRPIVLNGDLTKYHLGLNDVDVQWVRDHCMAVIHNAASLSFTGNDRNAEPWVSNLNGTRNVLELCRSTGIRRFYHVSTAYICGDRRGEVYENEMDVGQQTSNDYEASKLAAEQDVRSAEWLNHVTVFRPSIIAGDSRTGFTSTFHGFYFPLKIAMNLSRLGAFSKLFDLKELLSTMGLDGTERKNFVPVDWVSSVIAKAVTSPELQGQTYHLTSEHPVTLSTMVNVMSEAIQKAYKSSATNKTSSADFEWMRNQFRLQMTAYRSYWRDDPEFCNANTQRMAEDLPCPPVTEATMKRWCQFAIDQNFQPPVFKAKYDEFDVHALLETRYSVLDTNVPNISLHVNGPGGGQWQLCWTNERITSVRRGGLLRHNCTTLYLNTNTFRNLARGLFSAERAILAGQVLVQGDSKVAARIIQQLTKNCLNERIESIAKTKTK